MRLPLLLLVLIVAACRPQGSGVETGAPNARAAVETFLAGARSQDLQVMARVWGTERGPAREQMDRREHEMRLLTMMCYLNHDEARVVNETPGETRRSLVIELRKGTLTGRTTFTAVPGPGGRWYVENAAIQSLSAFCREQPRGPA